MPLDEATADHHPVPLKEGGRSSADNIKAACRPCNNARDQPPGQHREHVKAWRRFWINEMGISPQDPRLVPRKGESQYDESVKRHERDDA